MHQHHERQVLAFDAAGHAQVGRDLESVAGRVVHLIHVRRLLGVDVGTFVAQRDQPVVAHVVEEVQAGDVIGERVYHHEMPVAARRHRQLVDRRGQQLVDLRLQGLQVG